MNPEFLRNVWLELTPGRLVAMPVVVGALIALASAIEFHDAHTQVTWVASILFFIFTGLWGTRRAAACVAEEIAQGTWDAQRMSGLDAWRFAWGKVLGSTIYTWYGAGFCLIAAAWGMMGQWSIDSIALILLTNVAVALTGQLVAFMVSLAAVRKDRSKKLPRISLGHIIGISVSFFSSPGISLADSSAFIGGSTVNWYGEAYSAHGFHFASAMVFTGFAFLGAYRAIRSELQYRNIPWAWTLFTVTIMIYAGGGAHGLARNPAMASLAAWVAAFVAGVFLVYIAAFAEDRNIVRYRRIWERFKRRAWPEMLIDLPTFKVGFWLLIICGVVVAAKANALPEDVFQVDLRFWNIEIMPDLWVISVLLFVARDVFILFALSFYGDGRQKDMAWLMTLIFLYLIIPALTAVFRFEGVMDWFLPLMEVNKSPNIVVPFIEAAVVGVLVMRKFFSTMPKTTATNT